MDDRGAIVRFIKLIALFVVLVAATWFIRIWLPRPFEWIGVLWTTALIFVGIRARRGRPLLFGAAVFVALVTAVETFLVYYPDVLRNYRFEGTYASIDSWRKHATYGYAPTPNRDLVSRRFVDDELIYEARYSYDEHALRTSAPPREQAEEAKGSALFFGGSFMVGEGVDDEETLPYRFSVRTDGAYDVFNFGYHGYGAHQMLGALEDGMVEDAVELPVELVVYLGISDHVVRATGRKFWDLHGPRYVRTSKSSVERRGQFHDAPPPAFGSRDWVMWFLRDSTIGRRFLLRAGGARPGEIETYAAIVASAKDDVERRWPRARFLVMFWNPGGSGVREIQALQDCGVETVALSEVLGSPLERFRIPGDLHPRGEAYDAIAEWLVDYVRR